MKTQVDGKHQLQQRQLVRQQGHREGRGPGCTAVAVAQLTPLQPGPGSKHTQALWQQQPTLLQQAIEDGKDKASREKN